MNKWNPDSPVNSGKRRSFYNLAKSERDTETKPTKTKRKTMTITEQTWDMVTEHGKKGQTYDRIIYEAILAAKQLEKVQRELDELKSEIVGLWVCRECGNKHFNDWVDPDYPAYHCEECGSKSGRLIGRM